MPGEDISAIHHKLAALRSEERELVRAIAAAAADGDMCDEVALTRMKKRHATLPDMIRYLEDKLIPDLDA